MKMQIVRIFPKTNFKEIFKSDTLWGNLIFGYKKIFGEKKFKTLLGDFLNGNPPFKVSSCFVFDKILNKNEFIDYFPKPFFNSKKDLVNGDDIKDMSYMKKFKQIKYLNKVNFEKFINGILTDLEIFEDVKKNNLDNYRSPAFINVEVLHNSIDRMRGSTLTLNDQGQLYWEREISFSKDLNISSGIFFLVQGDSSHIIPILNLLTDIGIGGNASIGKGSFDYTIENYNLNIPSEYNCNVSLSLINDSDAVISNIQENRNSFYELEIRSGYSYFSNEISPVKKNRVFTFKEGSVFDREIGLNGRLVDVAFQNDIKIYNYYYSFLIPAKLN